VKAGESQGRGFQRTTSEARMRGCATTFLATAALAAIVNIQEKGVDDGLGSPS
jgi:hypothetical protein